MLFIQGIVECVWEGGEYPPADWYSTLHVTVYRIALIFRGSKFSRIAVFGNFVEIISRMRAAQYATPTISEFPAGAYTWQTR